VDENIATALILTDSGTVDTVRPTNSADDNSDDCNQTQNNKCEVLPVPSAVHIRSMVSNVRCYLQAY
jgi:hypothetical protein